VKQQHAPELPNQKVTTTIDAAQAKDYAQSVMREFILLLEAHQAAFKQTRSFARCAVLAFGLMFAFARHSVAQCVLSLGQGGRDWSAWYRLFGGKRFKQEDLDEILLGEMLKHVTAEEPFVVALDGTQTPHTSQRMPGCGLGLSHRTPAFARGLHVCRRWVTCAWLPAVAEGFTRAIPLRFLPAFSPKSAAASVAPCTESQGALAFLGWLRAGLDAWQRTTQRIVLLVDAAFDTQAMWRKLPVHTIMITRTAKNRMLFELPGAYVGKGRPRLYGAQVPKPEDHLHNRSGWHQAEINVRGRIKRMRFKLSGAYLRKAVPNQPVYLLVIDRYEWMTRNKTGRRVRHEHQEGYYLISAVRRNGIWDLPYPAEMLLQWVWQRWEVEVTHRDLKAGFGVGQMQCWGKISSVLATPWCVWVFALMLLSAYRAWGWQAPYAVDCAWWRGARRWSFNTVWRYFRIALWRLDTFRALAAQTPRTASKVNAAWLCLRNAVLAAARA
jgi:hypothetical protein